MKLLILALAMATIPAAGAAGAEVTAAQADKRTWLLVGYGALAVLASLGAAIAAGGEMGLYSVNRVRLKLRARAHHSGETVDRSAAVLKEELEHPARLLGTMLVCYNLLSYFSALGMTGFMRTLGLGDLAIVAANLLFVTPMLFVFVDAVPMEVFRLDADRLTYKLAIPLHWARIILTWTGILPVVQAAARGLSMLFRGADESGVQSARDRITALLKEGARHGAMSETQVGLLDRALALRETLVSDQMTPWNSVVRIEEGWDRARILDSVLATPYSRFPVVTPRGGVIGMVETLDACMSPELPILAMMKPVLRLPESLHVREALQRLADEGAAIAVVTARGRETPLGIVTAKDLVEPLTGEMKVF